MIWRSVFPLLLLPRYFFVMVPPPPHPPPKNLLAGFPPLSVQWSSFSFFTVFWLGPPFSLPPVFALDEVPCLSNRVPGFFFGLVAPVLRDVLSTSSFFLVGLSFFFLRPSFFFSPRVTVTQRCSLSDRAPTLFPHSWAGLPPVDGFFNCPIFDFWFVFLVFFCRLVHFLPFYHFLAFPPCFVFFCFGCFFTSPPPPVLSPPSLLFFKADVDMWCSFFALISPLFFFQSKLWCLALGTFFGPRYRCLV